MCPISCNSHINFEEVKEDLKRISKIKAFLNKYKWEGIKNPTKKGGWEKFKNNNPTIASNVFCTIEKEICVAYISKINAVCQKQ